MAATDPGPSEPRGENGDARRSRIVLSVCGGVLGFALAYLAVDYFRLPRLYYDPVGGGWVVARDAPTGISMGYYGGWINGVLGWVIGYLVTFAAVGLGRSSVAKKETIQLGSLWALSILTLCAAYFIYQNWP
jgi:hypothetical protein